MKNLTGILALLAMAVVVTGCVSSTGFSAGKISAGVNSRAHVWETPHFTADLESNPVHSELGMGFVTVGSQAGFGDHPDGKWLSFHSSTGPEIQSE